MLICGYGEMADTSASGADEGNLMQVQVLLSASKNLRIIGDFFFYVSEENYLIVKIM